MANNILVKLESFFMHYTSEQKTPRKRDLFFHARSSALENIIVENKHFSLKNISITIEKGEKIAVLGKSAAGKTSLLYAIQHYYDNIVGNVHFEGELQRPKVGVTSVKQDPKAVLNPIRTVYNAFRCLYYSHEYPHSHVLSKDEVVSYLREAGFQLNSDEEIKKLLKKKPHQLSGGMAQRVMVALILAMQPSILLADEMTASLDMDSEKTLMDMLCAHIDTMLIVTHRLHLVEMYCNRILFFHEGNLLFDGSIEAFKSSSIPEAKKYIEHIMLIQ